MKLKIISQYHPAAHFHAPRKWAEMLDDWENLPEQVPHDFRFVTTQSSLRKNPINFNGMPLVALDTEQDGQGGLGQWSVAYRDGEHTLWVISFYGQDTIEFSNCPVVFHNAKYDLRVLRENKMHEPASVHDTMIMAYCVIPQTKILYRDLTWREIGKAKVGDELIGVDEHLPWSRVRRGRRRMLPTTVTAVGRRVAPCYEIRFSNGKKVIASEEHPWLTQQLGNRAFWIRTDQLRLHWQMLGAIPTWERDLSNEAGYTAGAFDSEGSWSRHSLQFCQKPNVVLNRVRDYLVEAGFAFGEYQREDGLTKLYLSKTIEAMRFLGTVRPQRLLGKEKWLGLSPTHTAEDVRITGVVSVGEQEVVSIETDIHTFNAEGFWTHNCLGLGKQAPKDEGKNKSGADMVGGLGLKYLTRRHLGMQMKHWQEMKDASPEEIQEYNAMDSVGTYLLAEKWLPVLPQHYFGIDMPLLGVLMAMEDRGVQIDPDYLKSFAAELDSRIAEFDLPLNVHAPMDIQSYIYGTLGIEPWEFTKGGAPSTEASVLEKINDPLVKQILEYKELVKDKVTYVENYIKMRDFNDRVHPEFKQTSTSTGRLSVARPSLQNVDKKGNMRKLIIAREGCKLVRLDYDQMEWRALAAITQDPVLLKELASGKKIHQVTADQMGISYDDAKTGNFAIQYGAQAWTLAQQLHCTIREAKEFMSLYFSKFPGVKRYQDMMREIARSERKVTNYFGRTRRIDAMYSEQKRIRDEGEKEAINMPIQGATGEVVKIGMIDLHYKHSAPMVLQVHDELIFEVPEKDAKEYAHWLKEYVPSITEINGERFPVDVSVGDNWKEVSK